MTQINHISLRATIRELIDSKVATGASLARETGQSTAVISQYLNDKYKGDNDAVAACLQTWFNAREAAQSALPVIDIRLNYYTGEQLPAGIACGVVEMTGGTANPDVSDVIAAMGDAWWNFVINPYTDQANLDQLSAELVKRWGPDKMIDGMCFMGYRGNLSEATTYGTTRNDFLFSTMGTNLAPEPPYIWAARVGAVCIGSLTIDPARPMQTLAVTGLKPPADSDRWPREDRETLLHDGISTYTCNGDTVQIERMITMYRLDSYGNLTDSG